jgi:cell division septum initiation protein DivIVA
MKEPLQGRIRCSELEPMGKAVHMPDQHTAATEHALIAKIAEPLDKLPDDPLAIVAVEFPVALRGYDRFAVDAYVERTSQLVAELQSTRSPEAAVRRALERVGEEISGILTRAHDTADEITTRSRAEAEERLEAARQEATQITMQAERRVKDLDAETERIWAERHSIVTDARDLARRLTELAESALERFPADASPADPPALAPQAPLPAHLFDGAVDERYPPLGGAADEETAVLPADEGTADLPTDEETAVLLMEDEHAAVQPAESEHAAVQPAESELPPDEQSVGRPIVDQPTMEQPFVDEEIVEQAIVDEPTVAMPPIEPWEDRPIHPPPWAAGEGPAGTGEA